MQRLRDGSGLKEALRAESRLEDVAAYYNVELKGNGDNLKACCPFHKEDTPSFSISSTKQLYFCFGCKEGGDVFSFVQKMENCPFDQALRKMAQVVGLNITPYLAEVTDEDRRNNTFYTANDWVAQLCVSGANEIKARDDWASNRQLNLSILDSYFVGYSAEVQPRGTHGDAFNPLRLDWNTMWTNTIVVPCLDAYGRLAGFRNRLLDGGKIKVLGPVDSHPLPVPPVYGVFEARKAIRAARGMVILVEGEIDVWQMVGAGFENTCAMQGTKLNEDMLSYLADSGITQAIVLADNDEAGRKFIKTLARAKLNSKILVKIATLMGEGSDPDDAIKLCEGNEIRDAIAKAKYRFEYLVDLVLAENDLDRMTGKIDCLQEVRPFITKASQLEQELAYVYLAQKLGLNESVVADFFREGEPEQAALFDVKAERIVIAQMLKDQDFIGDAVMALRPTDFYLDKHRVVFETIGKLYREQEQANVDTVRTVLGNKAKHALSVLDGIGEAGDGDSASYLLSDLRDKAVRREVQKSARAVATKLSDTSADTGRIISSFTAELARSVVGSGDKLNTADQLVNARIRSMHEQMKNPNAIVGLDLGEDWRTLTLTLHGIQRKWFGVLAAPSGIGKTAVAIEWAAHCAVSLNEPTLFFTFETSPESLTTRMISNMSGVEADKIVTGHIEVDEAALIHEAGAAIAKSPLIITSRGAVWEEFQNIVRHDVLRRGTRIVFVDYIQLMRLADPGRIARYLELGTISGGMLEMCADLNISMIAVAQMNREGIKAGSNAKENVGDSYKIMQDADWAYIIREKSKEELDAEGPAKGDCFGMLDKNRHGRDKVGTGIHRDMSVLRIKEARRV